MNQWVGHRDQRWYDDPLRAPTRTLDEGVRKVSPELAHFPVAAGPRRCIGDRFAMLEARLLLATIFEQYHIELTPGAEPDLTATIMADRRRKSR